MSGALGCVFGVTIDDYSNVWTFGDNSYGQLARDCGYFDEIPRQVTSLVDITRVACGNCHSICVDVSGNVFSFGDNTYGQRGVKKTPRNIRIPCKVDIEENIIDVGCGLFNSFFIDCNNLVWACGHNAFGQLGMGHTSIITTPSLVRINNVQNVDGGEGITTFLHLDKTISVCGVNRRGELGLARRDNFLLPEKIPQLVNIVSMGCGRNFSAVVNTRGELLCFGLIEIITNQTEPYTIKFPDESIHIVSVSCGNYHIIALDNKGYLWGIGYNRFGQLGLGDIEERKYPEKLNLSDVLFFTSGADGNIVKTKDGIYVFGKLVRGESITTTLQTIEYETIPNKLVNELNHIIGMPPNYKSSAKSARNVK